VIITPHAAYYSEESIGTVRRIAAEEAVRVLCGQAPRYAVNAVIMAAPTSPASASHVRH
jgi:D-3-phosphoglycerate dehydrogenase